MRESLLPSGEGQDEGISRRSADMWRRDGGAVVIAVDDEIVTLRLAADGFIDGGIRAGRRSSERRIGGVEVGGVVLTRDTCRACRCRSAGPGCSFRRNCASAA